LDRFQIQITRYPSELSLEILILRFSVSDLTKMTISLQQVFYKKLKKN
jgi:hypothetical protein